MRTGTEALRRADRALCGAFAIVLALELCYIVPNIYIRPADAAVVVVQPRVIAEADVNSATGSGFGGIASALTQAAVESLDTEQGCLALAVYHEARGESRDGQRAVAEVVLHRTKAGYFPKSVCGVVLQGMQLRTGCQFSFTCNGAMKSRRDWAAWARAVRVAEYMMDGPGKGQNYTQGAVYFHADYVDPVWAASKERTIEIGRHIFYREAPRVREG